MRTELQALNFTLTEGLPRHFEHGLGFALSARDEHIQRIRVRLTDINGPKGGQDMC